MNLPALLLITGTASILATLPQLTRLIKLKRSGEFSIISWIVWLIYQIVTLAYAISLGVRAYEIINSLWVIFYLTMVVLILRYRSGTSSRAKR
jgi:uncharacterized protein with PQ loop repeat